MRRADLIMGIVMAVLSLFLMWESTELPIGWLPGLGPGGGAFPFWSSVGMLICSLVMIVRWLLRISPLSQSTEIYMSREAFRMFLMGAGALTVTIALFHIVGVYVALPLFIIFYLRVVGGHSWRLTGSVALSTPPVLFLFFELTLHITLPKGLTEPLFYPLYAIFY